jgi:predicted nucleic acid-binding protein
VNASPVITLAKVGQHELLGKLTDSLLLPDAVAGEILAGPITDPAAL